jgi:hypothetical protein
LIWEKEQPEIAEPVKKKSKKLKEKRKFLTSRITTL